MKEIVFLLLGAVGGFLVHAVTMKISFKQRVIDNKIKIYDALIANWVKMRNFVYAKHPENNNQDPVDQSIIEFDQMYGLSQTLVAEAILICEDKQLTIDINDINERLYRNEWQTLSIDEANEIIEALKKEAFDLVARMREDIQSSTRLELDDFKHIFHGLFHRK